MIEGCELELFVENQNTRVIVLLLMEKAFQRIALSQEVESGLGYAQHEGLTCQLTEPKHITGDGEGTVVLPALVKGCNLLVLAEAGLLAGNCPPLQGDDQRFRRIWKEVSDGVADTVQ